MLAFSVCALAATVAWSTLLVRGVNARDSDDLLRGKHVVGGRVASRRQELAIRSALGASGPTLVWLVLRQVMVAGVIGAEMGAGMGALGILTVHRLAPQWISVAVATVASITLAVTILVSTAVLDGYLPARSAVRATSVAWLARR